MLIYKATNKINGKLYIGQTVRSLESRKQRHISEALNKSNNMYIGRAIRKYGSENFDWCVLHECSNIDDLNQMEIHYIKLYNTFNTGYNLTLGGEGVVGCIPSNETKKKLSELQKGKNNSFYGKKHSEKTKKEMSKTRRGKGHPLYGKRGKDNPRWGMKHTKKSILKMSETLKGEKHYFYGKKRSEEFKQNISEKNKGKNHPNYGKFGKYSSRTRAVIIDGKYFYTCKEAAEFVGIDPSAIGRRIKKQYPGYQYA